MSTINKPTHNSSRRSKVPNKLDDDHSGRPTELTQQDGESDMQLRSQGEMEAALCDVIRRYSVEYLGRGPRDVRAYLVGDMLLVRVYGVLTILEQHLAKSGDDSAIRLVKQIRSQLILVARQELEALIRLITEVQVISVHHDISPETGEEIIVFTLSEAPRCRRSKQAAPNV